MEYELPSKENYTIYSKSGCTYCVKAKQLLVNEAHEIIDCDDYLVDDKEGFLAFMQTLIGKEYRTFPMIFDKGGQFLGGFTELKAVYQAAPMPSSSSMNNDFPDPFA